MAERLVLRVDIVVLVGIAVAIEFEQTLHWAATDSALASTD